MSALSQLVTVLRKFGWSYKQDSYEPKENEKMPERYIVYNVAAERPDCFEDDEPKSEEVSLQVHMYLPKKENYLEGQKKLKSLLFQAGFHYPSVTLNTTELDTGKRHICLETGIQTESEDI